MGYEKRRLVGMRCDCQTLAGIISWDWTAISATS